MFFVFGITPEGAFAASLALGFVHFFCKNAKKYKNFSIIVANTLFVLSAIKKTPGISTRELAEKLEVSERSVQRYIETLRIAGEWIEYDTALKGWKLSVGKSVLWDDF